jgi:hypothetical protein
MAALVDGVGEMRGSRVVIGRVFHDGSSFRVSVVVTSWPAGFGHMGWSVRRATVTPVPAARVTRMVATTAT